MADDTYPPLPSEVLGVDLAALNYREWRSWRAEAKDRWAVYALLDEHDEMFYVGRSRNVADRMSNHRQTRAFGKRARFVRYTEVSSEWQASGLELLLIHLVNPSANIQHRWGVK